MPEIHMENAPGGCKFCLQAVGRKTVRPSESQDGGRRSKDGNRGLETWRESN